MGIYADDGSFNVTEVDGSTYTGLYSADGAYNVVVVDGSTYTGLYAPCGAYNVCSYVSGPVSIHHPCGAFMISESPYTEGTMKVTFI